MNIKKLGKAKNSINELDANKGSSGVSDTQMALMYNLSNKASEISDDNLEDKTKLNNNSINANK